MTIHIPKKHISINCADSMSQISSPLFELGISYFEHVRIYHDGKIAWLSTNDLRAKTILENEIAGALEFDFNKLKKERYIFADDLVETIKNSTMKKIATKKLVESKDNYDIRNLFQIISVKDDTYEAFVFGTNETNNLSKTEYINNILFLEEFIVYYYNCGFNLINAVELNAIQVPDLKIITCDDAPNKHVPFNIQRYYFDLSNHQEYLTTREYEVCRLLYRGYSRKSVAANLGVKTKTVDSLIANVINRNSCYNLKNLFSRIKKSDLRHLFER